MRLIVVRVAVLLILAFTLMSSSPGPAMADQMSAVDPTGNVVTATYEGQPIDPMLASHYFCHTRDYPIVRCFATQEGAYQDLELDAPLASHATPLRGDFLPDWSGGAYTIAYWDINYGGSSLIVYGALSSLVVIGWNDAISSIKSVNCGIPRYYVHINYSGGYWQNGCNTWSPNVGTFNDTFSSVINMAP